MMLIRTKNGAFYGAEGKDDVTDVTIMDNIEMTMNSIEGKTDAKNKKSSNQKERRGRQKKVQTAFKASRKTISGAGGDKPLASGFRNSVEGKEKQKERLCKIPKAETGS